MLSILHHQRYLQSVISFYTDFYEGFPMATVCLIILELKKQNILSLQNINILITINDKQYLNYMSNLHDYLESNRSKVKDQKRNPNFQETAHYQSYFEKQLMNPNKNEQTAYSQKPRNPQYFEKLTPSNQSQSTSSKEGLAYFEKQPRKDLKSLLQKLKVVKKKLEEEIISLQGVLDSTSKYLDYLDFEYQNIKEKILQYTSRKLDETFRVYKSSMAKWSKYEKVEKKSIQTLIEATTFLDNQSKIINSDKQVEPKSSKQMEARIRHYDSTAYDVKRVKQQCLEKHPHLKIDNIKRLEEALECLSFC